MTGTAAPRAPWYLAPEACTSASMRLGPPLGCRCEVCVQVARAYLASRLDCLLELRVIAPAGRSISELVR